MRRYLHRYLLPAVGIAVFLSCAGCKPDLKVKEFRGVWAGSEKKDTVVIANTGNADAGEFMVYFNAEENPVSENHRPQVSHRVPGLAKGATLQLTADFAPLVHRDNVDLSNVYKIVVLLDPKSMVDESDEANNSSERVLLFRNVCVDFGPPPALGTQFGVPAGNVPGSVVLITPTGVRMAVQGFRYVNGGGTFNRARIEIPPVAFGTGQTIRANNINMEFNFLGIGYPVWKAQLQYLDLGGFENLSVNGLPVPVYAGELAAAPLTIGGVDVFVTSAVVAGGKTGTVTFVGPIQKIAIGGQELWIDNVCARN